MASASALLGTCPVFLLASLNDKLQCRSVRQINPFLPNLSLVMTFHHSNRIAEPVWCMCRGWGCSCVWVCMVLLHGSKWPITCYVEQTRKQKKIHTLVSQMLGWKAYSAKFGHSFCLLASVLNVWIYLVVLHYHGWYGTTYPLALHLPTLFWDKRPEPPSLKDYV